MRSAASIIDRAKLIAPGPVKTAALVALELATTIRVVATLVIVEVLVRAMPLPRLGRLLGCHVDLTPTKPMTPMTPKNLPIHAGELTRHVRRQLRCTHRVADVWPFSRGPCLRRALVGGHLVRSLDPSIRLGLTGIGDELSAHAWLEVGGRPLEDVDEYSRFEVKPRREAS